MFAAMKKILAAVTVALLLVPGFALAQKRITITEGTIEPTPIAIANFTGIDGLPSTDGLLIAEIISNDLAGSGMFSPEVSAALIPPPADPSIRPDFAEWAPLGVKALLVGSATRDTNGMIEVVFILWDVVTEREIVAGEGEVSELGLRRISHQIADLVFESWTGDEGYFDTRIVYVEESGPANRRVKRLAIMDQDGHNHSYLTDGSSLVLTPRFSPMVQEIAYLDYFNDNPNVYLMNVSSGQSELLGTFPGMTFAPRFSFDGKKLIMSLAKSGLTDIFEMDLSTQSVTQLTKSPSIDTSPSYSPDGSRIVFNSDRSGTQQLYVMKADGRGVKRISFGEGRYATPVWSPRGDMIAFTKMYRGEFYIGVMNVDGTGERLLSRGFLVEAPTWAPNGRVLMYFKQNPTESDGSGGESYLYRIDITGFNERRMITPTFASDPAWSPRLP
ncbi:MAG: Dipeptidyl-peptidase 5 [SAR116 cluster bacterium MED-G04]|jgi:TolB protein|nr:Tol-Pal system beta propeller repeat protein TolB [SAR116 cluster bacterium]OUW36530.1 MAG: Tol-Pal system beta propeller repeat protein TolB [Gammaproteobacteria bacterium TMED183]CAI8444794.1 MAG: Dipeptidyl-peptidase 5 [SAR116 cluster bacterium MED-G04]HCD48908.1 Tol-Pal system protein TolB [Alphaproteobacteria bacterium]HCV62174.1 Tol-Pal system protein TolB [Alphaproteobacteria bacterium]|tara:strand:- start:327 stop:1658 length:1332 start_codon:yes stop_codon:yes gene_type:complete